VVVAMCSVARSLLSVVLSSTCLSSSAQLEATFAKQHLSAGPGRHLQERLRPQTHQHASAGESDTSFVFLQKFSNVFRVDEDLHYNIDGVQPGARSIPTSLWSEDWQLENQTDVPTSFWSEGWQLENQTEGPTSFWSEDWKLESQANHSDASACRGFASADFAPDAVELRRAKEWTYADYVGLAGFLLFLIS